MSPKAAATRQSPEVAVALAQIDTLRDRVEQAKARHGERWPAALQKLKVLWTADSNAIEGSTLTFGETKFFLETGLTVGGKPLKDFLDAKHHYEAIELLFEPAAASRPITEGLLKELNALLLRGVTHAPSVNARRPAYGEADQARRL
jgi:Fic family protein